MLSELLATSSRVTYLPHIEVEKYSSSTSKSFLCLRIFIETRQQRRLWASQALMTKIIFILLEEEIFLMIQVAEVVFNNDNQPGRFHAKKFYKHANIPLKNFTFASRSRKKCFSTFFLFLETKIQKTKLRLHTTLSVYIRITRPFDCKTWGKARTGG